MVWKPKAEHPTSSAPPTGRGAREHTMSKHTPGPWVIRIVNDQSTTASIRDRTGQRIARDVPLKCAARAVREYSELSCGEQLAPDWAWQCDPCAY